MATGRKRLQNPAYRPTHHRNQPADRPARTNADGPRILADSAVAGCSCRLAVGPSMHAVRDRGTLRSTARTLVVMRRDVTELLAVDPAGRPATQIEAVMAIRDGHQAVVADDATAVEVLE